jgi:hypothetical protein
MKATNNAVIANTVKNVIASAAKNVIASAAKQPPADNAMTAQRRRSIAGACFGRASLAMTGKGNAFSLLCLPHCQLKQDRPLKQITIMQLDRNTVFNF